jgi:hypothetical protein
MVTKVLVGFLKKSSANSGITSIESGKLVSKVYLFFLLVNQNSLPQRHEQGTSKTSI